MCKVRKPKVLVNFGEERCDEFHRFFCDLQDCGYSAMVYSWHKFNPPRLIIDQGPGPNRIMNFHIPFERIESFEAVPVSIGLKMEEGLDSYEPVTVLVRLKLGGPDPIWSFVFGTTPTPLMGIDFSKDKCVQLSQDALKWVRDCNRALDEIKEK